MIDLAIISGAGFHDLPWLENGSEVEVKTKWGDIAVRTGHVDGRAVAFISRHQKNHVLLPNMINHRANMLALKELGAKAFIATTVCGVLDPALPLARPVVFKDIFFPDNRLPNGEACTMFTTTGTKEKGHYVFDRPFSEDLRRELIRAAEEPITEAVYAYVCGPRFNSKAEIRFLSRYASLASQTAGPEIILAGELGIPCALLGFGVDYANGVQDTPTSIEAMNENVNAGRAVLATILAKVIRDFHPPKFEGTIHRFE